MQKGCTGWRKWLTSDLKCTEPCKCFEQCTKDKSCWFIAYLILVWKNISTDWYYNSAFRTTTTNKVEHCEKNSEKQAFSNLYFPVFGLNQKFYSNTGKWRSDSFQTQEYKDYRNPVFGRILQSGVLCDIN